MATKVEKIEVETGERTVLHPNLPNPEARELAKAVIAGNDEGAVQVVLTPFVWNDENAEYVPDVDAQVVLPAVETEAVADEPKTEKPKTAPKGGKKSGGKKAA